MRISIGGTKSNIIISPNPVVGQSIALQLINQAKGRVYLRVIDLNGKELLKSTFINMGGSNVQTIKAPSSVTSGIYQLEIVDAKGIGTVQSLLFL